ncbi:gas vesicle protein [Pseudalkalibacillus sp. SCS-8]|uniref:gas vesicle protein n=1 Tax=Pseudalkalibacillus nanhaiensis TaxID=3115291 RepID=UPI0032DAFC5B
MSPRQSIENKEVALVDILDVVLDKGVAIRGDILISIAGIDLVYLDLKVLISSVETLVNNSESENMEFKEGDMCHASRSSNQLTNQYRS